MDNQEQIKKCTKCFEDKLFSEYRKQKRGKYGLMSVCKLCQSKIEKTERKNNPERVKKTNHEQYIKNRDKRLEYNKNYRKNNHESLKEYDSNYRKNNKEKRYLTGKRWREKNSEILSKKKSEYSKKNRNRINEYERNKRKKDGNKHPYRTAWRNILKDSLERLGRKKEGHTIDLLGYSALQLKQRLECQFTEGMSWENYGEWHIDHKKPVSRFNKGAKSSIVNSLSNLQPLWATNRVINGVFYKGNLNKFTK